MKNENLEPISDTKLSAVPEKKYLNRAEWCFQFFNTEPVPFAYSKEDSTENPLVLEVQPIESDGIQFSYKGMSFRIFPREMSEETKKELENANKDKEVTSERSNT